MSQKKNLPGEKNRAGRQSEYQESAASAGEFQGSGEFFGPDQLRQRILCAQLQLSPIEQHTAVAELALSGEGVADGFCGQINQYGLAGSIDDQIDAAFLAVFSGSAVDMKTFPVFNAGGKDRGTHEPVPQQNNEMVELGAEVTETRKNPGRGVRMGRQ